MREEAGKGAHNAKGTSLFAAERRAHGFAVVLDQDDVTTVDYLRDGVEIIGISEQVHDHHGSCLVGHRVFERGEVVVQRFEVDIDVLEVQPVLVERLVCRRPTYGRDYDLVAGRELERGVLGVGQRCGHQQVR